MSVELVAGIIPALLTILVFSRLIGDSPAFRVAQYLFVGVSLGYAFVVIYHQVLRPAGGDLLAAAGQPALLTLRLTPFLLGLLLLARVTARQSSSWLANIPLALIFGVGAALAVGGALVGTILPQLLDTARPAGPGLPALLGSLLLLAGTVLSLLAFTFTRPADARRARWLALSARAGRWLLLITFGFFLAGAVLTYLTALSERLEFLIGWLRAAFGL